MAERRKSEPVPFPAGKPGKKAKPRRSAKTVLDDLAEVVAKAYTDELLRWQQEHAGKIKKLKLNKEVHRKAFRAMAANFVDRKIMDYRSFIRVQFEERPNRHIAPLPQHCHGDSACSKWFKHQAQGGDVATRLAVALKFQRGVFSSRLFEARDMAEHSETEEEKARWPESAIVSYVLDNVDYELSSLFRYGVAMSASMPDVAASHRQAAFLQYLFAKEAYDQVWGDLVPADLAADADMALLEIQAAARALNGKR